MNWSQLIDILGPLSISVPSLFLLCLAFALVIFSLRDPLKHVPGPFWAKWTAIPLKVCILNGSKTRRIHYLHQKYGPMVRVGPNDVSTTDLANVKIIYRVGSPFAKSDWYSRFNGLLQVQEKSMFTETDLRRHAHHRRLQSTNFSEKWIKTLEPQIVQNIKKTAAGMRKEVDDLGHVDVLKWFMFMATDVIGEAAFGESFNLLESGKKNQYIYDLEKAAFRSVLCADFTALMNFISRIPFGWARTSGEAGLRVAQYGRQSIERYSAQFRAAEEKSEDVKPTLVSKMYRLVDEGSVTYAQICRDAMGYIVAGTDTTANTMTYLMWVLANRPDLQERVIREMQGLGADPTDEEIRAVVWFDHLVKETLRLYGAAPGALPRLVPDGGATFGGQFFPAGTVVSTQAYSLHRDPEIWEDPLRFDPSRWENPTKAMRDAFMPFGAGSRVCIGKHLAELEIHHALVEFYQTFPNGVAPALVEGFTPEEMEQDVYFLAQPRGKRCLLRPL